MDYVIHIRNLKHALNYRLIFKKEHRVTKFNHKDCLKPYIDVNEDLRKKRKERFRKRFLKADE